MTGNHDTTQPLEIPVKQTTPTKLRHEAEVIERLGVKPFGMSGYQIWANDFKRIFSGREVKMEHYMGEVHYKGTIEGVEFRACEGIASDPPKTVTLPKITTEEEVR